jgi:CheY-like chemotaxis protein
LAPAFADAGQVEQVVMNLAVNARDAMPGGGKLTIETGSAELDAGYAAQYNGVRPGHYVMVAVSDTGVGMDSPTQARIFQPFFTTKGPGQGTGLGLSTVDEIVRQHGGHVWLYSEPGRGTVFKVYLPRAAAATAAPAPEAQTNPVPRGSETVLVVEDTHAVRSLVARVLEGLGYRVLEATDAATAELTAARYHGPIHLLFSDLVMPGDAGPQLAERVRAARPEMRVLFTSGYADDAVVHHGWLTPDAAYLQKPFTPDALGRKVREVLD